MATATANSLTITRPLNTLTPIATLKITAAEAIRRPVTASPWVIASCSESAVAAPPETREKRKMP